MSLKGALKSAIDISDNARAELYAELFNELKEQTKLLKEKNDEKT